MEVEFFPAPGKLNLFLHVVGRRADGYHELQTAFRMVEAADRIRIRVREDGRVVRSGAAFENDLCEKAANALKSASASPKGCDIELQKHLPVGGGLGGGSSDAATVLLVLNRLWGVDFERRKLMELGLQLGADVPFFLYGRSAFGEGVGERLEELDLPPAWYLVLIPQVSVSTKEIFADASLTRDTKRLKIAPFLPGQGRNDLEPVVSRRFPGVAAHLEWLKGRAPGVRMTGSGACVFAEFRKEAEALALMRELPGEMRGFVTRGLDRHPLYDWAK